MERNFLAENITLQLTVSDLCVIGKTLSDRYTGSQINAFINPLNRAIETATDLEEIVSVAVSVERLIEIIEILGNQSEFLYNDFNKTVEQKFTDQLITLATTDPELVQFITERLTERKARILAYKNGLIKWYIISQGLNIDISSLEPPAPENPE